MKYTSILIAFLLSVFCYECKAPDPVIPGEDIGKAKFSWDNATIYFLMTDRFYNGDQSNDFTHPESAPPAPYRGFMGGDIKGITKKIEEGYFNDLGVDAIWMTPLVEQIQGSVDEGTGTSYPFHGYWTRDWTEIDSRFGTKEELLEMVQTAHDHNIRVLFDVVANHTGPVTAESSVWPDDWVRTGPRCTYQGAETTISCTLVENLPDILTDSQEEVQLPQFLVDKWKAEGRYEQEVKELDLWFAETGYKRTPVNYILKWLVDFIKEYGIDGYRVDTVKHTEDFVWADLYRAADAAYQKLKVEKPEMLLPNEKFYMVGEVYNYFVDSGRMYDYNDQKVDFFKDGFHALINFDLRSFGNNDYETIFSKYDKLIHGPLKGKSIVNYMSSHDDGSPFDKERAKPFETLTKLMLTPGAVQMYYGDESARSLNVKADGDATLRSFMNWDEMESDLEKNGYKVNDVHAHAQKLGKFRQAHISIGAGRHKMISQGPYLFERKLGKDEVVIGLDLSNELTSVRLSNFANGTKVKDAYSGKVAEVKNGTIDITGHQGIVLLEAIN